MTEPSHAQFLQPKMSFAAAAAFPIIGELMKEIPSSSGIHPRITFPVGGFYVCLSLVRRQLVDQFESLCDFNLLSGRFHMHCGPSPEAECWPEPRSYCLAAVGQQSQIRTI